MQTENNNFAMLVIHAEQLQVWAETLLHEAKYNNLKFKSPNFKPDLIALTTLIKRFNTSLKSKLGDSNLHEETAANISKICELLAKTNPAEGAKFLEAIQFIASKAEVLCPNDNICTDLMEKLTLISQINDKLINFPIKELHKVSKQILNTPTK